MKLYSPDITKPTEVNYYWHEKVLVKPMPKPKRGEWVKVDDSVQPICSKCGISCSGIHRNADYSVVPTWNYCPNCGAKMRLE